MTVDDSYTKSLLHFDGADGSTTFTDEAGHNWAVTNDSQIDTAQSVFGGASGYFHETDRIYANDHADWRLDDGDNSKKWTIDFRLRFNGDPSGSTNQYLMGQYVDANNSWYFGYVNTNYLYFTIKSGGSVIVSPAWAWNPADATWYHIAIVKDGTNGYGVAVNGSFIGAFQTDTDPMPDFAAVMTIGRWEGNGAGLIGWLDEFRLSKGIARWTSNFTPPAYAYHGTLIGKVNGVAYANIKSVSGVAIAAISSAGGVS